jgi:hypothetical protein
MSNLIKTLPVGDELFHADRRTHMTTLTVNFPNLAKTPNKKLYKVKNISDNNTLFSVL